MSDADFPRTYDIPGTVRNGVVVLIGRAVLEAAAADLGDGAPLIVTVAEDLSVYRSARANRYYWAIVVRAGVKLTENSAAMVHAGWKAKFLPDADMFTDFFNWFAGQQVLRRENSEPGSKNLPVADFYDYVEECRQWLRNEYRHETPDPDPLWWRRK